MSLSLRAAQASADLRMLAAPGIDRLAPHLEGRFVEAGAVLGALNGFVADPVSRLDDVATCFVLEDIALDPDLPDAVAQLAFALHLAERLSVEEPSDSAALVWPEWAASFAASPPAIRAVWMNAARELSNGYLAELGPIDPALCLGKSRDDVCAPLCAIAREATPELLRAIAMADYGDRWEQHLAALEDVIVNRACVIPKGETWFPLETVQLKSHVPREPGHVAALAILLVTSIHNGDCFGDIDYRWQGQADAWRAFPDRIRKPVMAAVRYLYQADPDFLSMIEVQNREKMAQLLID